MIWAMIACGSSSSLIACSRGIGRYQRIAGFAVGGVVVFAAEQVVIDPGVVRDAGVEGRGLSVHPGPSSFASSRRWQYFPRHFLTTDRLPRPARGHRPTASATVRTPPGVAQPATPVRNQEAQAAAANLA